MPEYPDVEVYLDCLRPRVLDQPLEKIQVADPFVLRSVDPPIFEAEGRVVRGLRRVGKRIVLALEGDLFVVIHLMIAGRLRWRERSAKIPRKNGLAAFDFPTGRLLLTEAGTKRRARLHLVRGEEALAEHDPGGLEVFECSREDFGAALRRGNHTLRRALTDPRILSGIGNAYSDEILHRARMSPVKLTGRLSDEEVDSLFAATREVLKEWTERLRSEAGDNFPEKVTAFHPEMAVHGRYGLPCPICGDPVQRIRYAENETNYCATCQTEGKLLADRSLSRLLKKDWPRNLDELELHRKARGG